MLKFLTNFCFEFTSKITDLAVIFTLDYLEFSDLFDRAIYVNYSLKRDSKTLILYSVSADGLIIGTGIFVETYTIVWDLSMMTKQNILVFKTNPNLI